jgi:dihydrofolate synthase / folylpolyglutamate synthase
MFTAYQKAIDWLFSQMPNYQNQGAVAYKPGLENIQRLCQHFGNPQDDLRCIHIAGTNGKGSISHMLAAVLQASGYKTGLYNSPHLVDFTERIKVDGQQCGHDFVLNFINQLQDLPSDLAPSFFEITTVMAFEYFKQQKVDFAIIEVGLGGRLDSTNIIQPILTAITNIDLDHQALLGNTIAEITREKAGIIKANIPVVLGDEKAEVQQIVSEIAQKLNAPYHQAADISHQLSTDLLGKYQQKNLKVLKILVDELNAMGHQISDEQRDKGLLQVAKSTNFMGRWQVVSEQPLCICDTGHNQAGLQEVFAQLATYPHQKHIVLGFVNDKNIDEVLPMLPKTEQYYFVKPQVERGRDPKTYENQLQTAGLSYKIFDHVYDAYTDAKNCCTEHCMIFIGGSNFTVGNFLEKVLVV